MTKKLSVIIPAYNAETFLERSVSSVLDNTYKDYELIIVDDGSSDDTLKVANKIAAGDDRVRVISQCNKGVGAARNAGLDNAEGEYIAFIDDDDIVTTDYLERLLEPLERHGLDWAACGYKEIWLDENEAVEAPQQSVFKNDVIIPGAAGSDAAVKAVFFGPNRNNLSSNAMGIYRKSVITDNNLRIDEKICYGEDTLFNYEVAHFIRGFAYIKDPLYSYVQREDSAKHSMFPADFVDREMQLIKEIDRLRHKYGDAVSNEMLAYVFMQIYHCCIQNIFLKTDAGERKKAFEHLDACLNEEPVSKIWEKVNIMRVGNFPAKVLCILLKSGRYELAYRIWRIKNGIKRTK